ncbi:hypothetical protein [Persicirhabdus sediminis]|nr:hypothetical protein [Persicirhabdus sediminis]
MSKFDDIQSLAHPFEMYAYFTKADFAGSFAMSFALASWKYARILLDA